MKTSIMKLVAALVVTAWMGGCASFGQGNPEQQHDLVYDASTYSIG